MKAVILAGGLGTRLSEETNSIPKPMVEIGGRPIIWHIMKSFSQYNVNDFVICCGYKGHILKNFFLNMSSLNSDISVNTASGKTEVHQTQSEDWNVTLVDTGSDSNTGGRLGRVREYLKDESDFFFTYGDGVSDVNIHKLLETHKKEGRFATVTSVIPPGRFGALSLKGSQVTKMIEKPEGDGQRINGGYFVLTQEVFKFIKSDSTIWEQEPLMDLADMNQLTAYEHNGFWQPMDTIRDKNTLEDMWSNNCAPWATWR